MTNEYNESKQQTCVYMKRSLGKSLFTHQEKIMSNQLNGNTFEKEDTITYVNEIRATFLEWLQKSYRCNLEKMFEYLKPLGVILIQTITEL